jgi:hypothetical protein
MEGDRVPTKAATRSVRIGGIDFDGTAEGDGTRYGPDGSLVGITVLNARLRLEEDGKIVLTLPEHRVEASDLEEIFAAA